MAAANSEQDILRAWRAISESVPEHDAGWKTIALQPADLNVRAGIRFPEREEAVLAGFSNVGPITELPKGRGFRVTEIALETPDNPRRWYGLSRQAGADPAMFLLMVLDVLSVLHAVDRDSERLRKFMNRIHAWQVFMEKHHDRVLGEEAETGLHGELLVLEFLLRKGMNPVQVVECWVGPQEGLHDFVLGQTAVEVKTTAVATGFPAKISSLEQLDDSTGLSIFLAGVKIGLQETGLTLPERIETIRALLAPDIAGAAFAIRLLHAGYVQSAAMHYVRRFSLVDTRLFAITSDFPRLTRSTVPLAVRQATYEIDLDLVKVPVQRLDELPHILGSCLTNDT